MNLTEFLITLGRSSAGAGALVLLVLITQYLFRKQLTPRWRCALWLLVLVRLLPFSLSSTVSIFNLVPGWPEKAVLVEPAEKTPGDVHHRGQPEIAVIFSEDRSSTSAQPSEHQPTASDRVAADNTNAPRAAARPPSRRLNWSRWVFAVWSVGVIGLLAHIAFVFFSFSRRLRAAQVVEDPAALRELRNACERLEVLRVPQVLESEAVASPALQGVFRPTLLLPSGFVSNFSLQELSFVFLHELAHLKRRDLVVNWIATFLQVLHWFNPLIWFGLARWRMDREVACDTLALEAGGASQRYEYGRTILRLLERRVNLVPAPGLVGILEDQRHLRRRMGMIAAYVPRPRWSLVGITALCILGVVGLTDAQGDGAASNTTKTGAPVASFDAPTPLLPGGKTRPLKITVLHAMSGQPVEGATVVAYPLLDFLHPDRESGGRKQTDASGEVVFSVPLENPEAAREQRFQVNVSHPHYGSREATWIADSGKVRESLDDSHVFRIQPGMTIGGYVQDEQGKPIAGAKVMAWGSDYQGFRHGSATRQKQEFATLHQDEKDAVKTNENGFWQRENVPNDLTQIELIVTRPGGGGTRFVTAAVRRTLTDPVPQVSAEDLKSQRAVLILKEGLTLHGIVTDNAGQPLNGVRLRARDADWRWGNYTFDCGIDGRFELPHWTAGRVIITAERDGYAITSVTLKMIPDMPEVRMVLPPAKGFRARLLGEKDEPIAGAEFRIQDSRSGDQLLDWQGTTNADGRIEWSNAPEMPITFAIISNDYQGRTAQFSGDGIEHVVRLKKGKNRSMVFTLRAIDAGSGQPIEQFEVFKRTNSSFQNWGESGPQGVFKAELLSSDFPKGFIESFRVQVRAPGYGVWTTDRIELSDGDQQLTAKLTKGTSPSGAVAEAPNPRIATSIEKDPSLLPVATAVAQLLETQDVAAFIRVISASSEDWKEVIPPGLDPTEGPLGKDPAAKLRSREKALTASANRVVDLAKRIGLEPGRLRFTVKTATAPMAGSLRYKLSGIEIPLLDRLQIVLMAELTDSAAATNMAPGECALSVSKIFKFPKGWRVEEGIRWSSFPLGLADEATRRDLELVNKIAGPDPLAGSSITGFDDPTLHQLADSVVGLLQQRDVAGFVNASTQSRHDLERFLVGQVGRSHSAMETAYQEINTSVTAAAGSLLDHLDRVGIDLSDAQIVAKHMIAERPSMTELGSLEGVRARSLQITFAVKSPRAAKSGVSFSGDYTLVAQNILRVGGRWVLTDSKTRWRLFPPGLLSAEESKTVEFENLVAEKRTLPPGMIAPDVDLVRLAKAEPAKLSAFRGKIVILEFWASWCGPCQEPMEKLQKLAEANPAWKDRVEIVTVSIDEKIDLATDHIAKRGWKKTLNTWAGAGDFKSRPAQAFRVTGVPATYLLGQDGKILAAGHPESMDFVTLVNDALR